MALVIAYETNNEHTISLLDMSPYLTVYHDKQVICKCQRANSTFSVLRHIKERIWNLNLPATYNSLSKYSGTCTSNVIMNLHDG